MKLIYKDGLKMEKSFFHLFKITFNLTIYCKVVKNMGFIGGVFYLLSLFDVTAMPDTPKDIAKCAIRIVREKSITIPRENLRKDE